MVIKVHATTSARINEIIKISEFEYKVKVIAPREKGLANEKIIELLADHLGLPKYHLNIKSGKTSKTKLITVLQ